MQKVSENYKNYINTNLSLSPKSKIVVDGVEYLGDKIKTAPNFSHSNGTFIGGFPTKIVDFEMYDFDNNIDFEGKEVEVYKGLVIDGNIEYIKQGIFIPQANNIETNISTKTISFKKVEDKTQFLNDAYKSSLDWTVKHTGLEIVQEICDRKNLILETTSFHFANYLFNQPNFPSKITDREVISKIAQIGGEIAIFNNNGNLAIKSQNVTGDIIQRRRYKILSREKAFSPNVLVIGNEGYDNDIKYPAILPNNPIEFKIEDNPFVDLNREEMIEDIANYILNISYIPFELNDFVDGFIYELNDVIKVTDKNGEIFNAVILDISTTSRIKSKISAPVKENKLSNYNLAGSKGQKISEVKLEVDHINNLINSIVKNVEGNTEQITQILQNIAEIIMSVQQSGGSNLIKNSVGFASTTEWVLTYDNEETSTVNTISNVELLQNGISGGAFQLNGVKIKQNIIVNSKDTYTFNCKAQKRAGFSGYIKVYNANDLTQIWERQFTNEEELNFESITFENIKINGNTLAIEFYGIEGSNLTITDSMLSLGDLSSVWTQASGEILNTQVNINLNGVMVKSIQFDENGQYVVMSPLEFAGYANKNGVSVRVFTVNGDTTEVENIYVKNTAKIPPIKLVPNKSGQNRGVSIVADWSGM